MIAQEILQLMKQGESDSLELKRSVGERREFAEMSGNFVVVFHKSKFTDEHLNKLGLTQRQRRAVEYVEANGRITNREYVELTGISPRTATRDLVDLVGKGVLRQSGRGKGSHF